MQQDYKIKWNDWTNVFQSAIAKCYQQQKFLDVILVLEEGTLFCHKIVLDSCSEYFASIFKNKFLDDKNKNIVICLPKDILLWEMQALLSYMYNGEVSISQEGLTSLIKSAEILKVKGLCGSSIKSSTKDTNQSEIQTHTKAHEIQMDDGASGMSAETLDSYETDITEKNENTLTKDTSSIRDNYDAETLNHQTENKFIRVKKDLIDSNPFITKIDDNEMSKKITFKKLKAHLTAAESKNIQENIVCSPELMQYIDDEKEESEVKSEEKKRKNMNGSSQEANDDNAELYELISQNYPEAMCDDSRVDSDDMNGLEIDQKSCIGGLFLRNPRGNQTRNYDVNALYSALEDVRKGISIYRAAQTYSIPRKTLRNWMKRLHIKSHFPMPKQLKQAAERKKNIQEKHFFDSIIKTETV